MSRHRTLEEVLADIRSGRVVVTQEDRAELDEVRADAERYRKWRERYEWVRCPDCPTDGSPCDSCDDVGHIETLRNPSERS